MPDVKTPFEIQLQPGGVVHAMRGVMGSIPESTRKGAERVSAGRARRHLGLQASFDDLAMRAA
jgi:hypothetical protein